MAHSESTSSVSSPWPCGLLTVLRWTSVMMSKGVWSTAGISLASGVTVRNVIEEGTFPLQKETAKLPFLTPTVPTQRPLCTHRPLLMLAVRANIRPLSYRYLVRRLTLKSTCIRNVSTTHLDPAIRGFTADLARKQPCFAMSSKDVHILSEPPQFYQRLLVSPLYLGEGEVVPD